MTSERGVVLIVDDDARIRQMMRWALEDEGLVVEAAADGREALDLAAGGAPALVVLDIMLPVLNGFEVAQGLRARYGEAVPILAVTGDGNAKFKASRVGAYRYVRKPFEVVDFLAAVREGLERGGAT